MKYRTIVADPPWAYDEGFGSSPASRGANPHGDHKRHQRDLPYGSLTVEQIAALPVSTWAEKDAVLYLWTTNRYLPAAFSVIEAWGFEYRQTLVWHKTGNPSPFGGSVAPIHNEFLLVGRRGKLTVERWPSSVVAAPAPNCGQHSAKPEVFLDHIEASGPGPYLEMFARRARLGDWHYWGDQSLDNSGVAA